MARRMRADLQKFFLRSSARSACASIDRAAPCANAQASRSVCRALCKILGNCRMIHAVARAHDDARLDRNPRRLATCAMATTPSAHCAHCTKRAILEKICLQNFWKCLL
jgi:hypothetical protein